MLRNMSDLIVVGGGLAGCEAAWQAANHGVDVTLFEMRPACMTPAHVTDRLAELVCSNSLGSDLPDRAAGVLKRELRQLDSLIMRCADETAVPAGGALAVDRQRFADAVTHAITHHPRITLRREEVTAIPQMPAIIASGPLTSSTLAADIARLTGQDHLYFYDAVAPIIAADSIDMTVAFRASRRGNAAGADYINCPMSRSDYDAFVDALVSAETIELKSFEREDEQFFEGCLPVEVIAKRGRESLAYGPLRPVGLCDPRTGKRPWAVVQLRQDDLAATLYNMVGFQTNLKWSEQARVFRMIPGLAHAEFLRYGMMHRNTFINTPQLLDPTMQYRQRSDLFFAGQITGVEGYIGNAATGYVAGRNAAQWLAGESPFTFPPETMVGALCHYVTHANPVTFQPMKASFGILPPLNPPIRVKGERNVEYIRRATRVFSEFQSMLLRVAMMTGNG
jgi:methylenetetrahydrofolate--tRNA-(uracil-5-)-methyltransferase